MSHLAEWLGPILQVVLTIGGVLWMLTRVERRIERRVEEVAAALDKHMSLMEARTGADDGRYEAIVRSLEDAKASRGNLWRAVEHHAGRLMRLETLLAVKARGLEAVMGDLAKGGGELDHGGP